MQNSNFHHVTKESIVIKQMTGRYNEKKFLSEYVYGRNRCQHLKTAILYLLGRCDDSKEIRQTYKTSCHNTSLNTRQV